MVQQLEDIYIWYIHMALHAFNQNQLYFFLVLIVQAGGYPTPFIVVGGLCLICLIPSMLVISTTSKLFILILSFVTCNNISEEKRQFMSLKVVAKLLNSFTFFLLSK